MVIEQRNGVRYRPSSNLRLVNSTEKELRQANKIIKDQVFDLATLSQQIQMLKESKFDLSQIITELNVQLMQVRDQERLMMRENLKLKCKAVKMRQKIRSLAKVQQVSKIYEENKLIPPDPYKIRELILEYFNLTLSDIVTKCRRPEFVMPRHFIGYFIKSHHKMSNKDVALMVGKTDHTWTTTAIRKLRDLSSVDNSLLYEINEVESIIQSHYTKQSNKKLKQSK